MKFLLFISLLLLASCSIKSPKNDPDAIVSMQLVDRNGFSETISTKDRLALYQHTDFLTPQPYLKILRVYGRNGEGKSHSKLTSYHTNGQISQYLEVVDGRAHGIYREWFSNGRLKLEAPVIEGIGDLSEIAQTSWLFDGKSVVRDEEGLLKAEIFYEKGLLESSSLYYHSNGTLWKYIPYHRNLIDGELKIWDENGKLIESILYSEGMRHGMSRGEWDEKTCSYTEAFEHDRLITASYYDPKGQLVSEIKQGSGKQSLFVNKRVSSSIEYQNGVPEGKVEIFDPYGHLSCSYFILNGKKEGEEWQYYPQKEESKTPPHPKLFLSWQEDRLQGLVKTWYENGILESQRELNGNKKEGMSLAWYKDGSLMLSEEYENNLLIKGSYFKKGDRTPISKVEGGKGLATLYNSGGLFLKKISYEKGLPVIENSD